MSCHRGICFECYLEKLLEKHALLILEVLKPGNSLCCSFTFILKYAAFCEFPQWTPLSGMCASIIIFSKNFVLKTEIYKLGKMYKES